MNIKEKILKEKKERDTVILAHVYQNYDILETADITGDSFALAQAAANIKSKRVIMCGVRFMAEMVKILSPEKEVILPVPTAGCPMAEELAFDDVQKFKEEHPDYLVAAYVNTTAELKTLADVCVTSSSAVRILDKMPQKNVLFIPDKNLGAYVQGKMPHKKIVTLDGCCPVHNEVTAEDIREIKALHPNAVVAAHPESPKEVLDLCDMIGATTEIIQFAEKTEGEVIIVTECEVVKNLNQKYNTNRFIQAAPEKLICEDMKATNLESVYNALIGNGGEQIEMDEEQRIQAKKSIDNMLFYGK